MLDSGRRCWLSGPWSIPKTRVQNRARRVAGALWRAVEHFLFAFLLGSRSSYLVLD